MASSAAILLDNTRLSRIDQRLFQWESLLALISGYAILSLMVLAVISVSGRQFFNQPLPGYVDWIEQAMPLIAFMGISYTQRQGGHIRMDMLVGSLKGRFLWVFELLTSLAILFLVSFLVWGTWAHFERSFDFNAPWWSRDSSIDIGIPLWPAKLIVPIAFSILVLRLLIQIWAYSRAFILGTENPVAVPLIQDAAQQAKQEADQLS
jgi:TRAP-type C4-dicarboxylate transport system permease small subunit